MAAIEEKRSQQQQALEEWQRKSQENQAARALFLRSKPQCESANRFYETNPDLKKKDGAVEIDLPFRNWISAKSFNEQCKYDAPHQSLSSSAPLVESRSKKSVIFEVRILCMESQK